MKSVLFKGSFIASFLFSFAAFSQQPGDTIEVQSFTYSSQTRDTVVTFPNDPNVSYEKIIMLYNMRCKDNKVSNGSNRNQGCGEWDYSCNTYLQDSTHIDSLLTSHPDYIISGYSGTQFDFINQATYNYYQEIQKLVSLDSIISDTTSAVGTGASQLGDVLPTAKLGAKSQYLFWHTEMFSAGMNAGNIDGITLNVNGNTAPADFLRVKIKHTPKPVLDDANPDLTGFTEVYYHNTPLTTGTNRIQFHTPFNWNGTDNIIIEFSFTNKAGNSNVDITGHTLTTPYGLVTSGDNNFNFNASNYVQINNYKGITGTGARTAEAWVRTTTAGKEIVSWGQNAVGKKWLLRLDGSGKFRVEVNSGYIVGTTVINDGAWHHLAVSFGGGNINTAQLYVDGQLETVSTSGSRVVNTGSSLNLRISRGFHNLYWQGAISNVRIWSDSLSQSVIADWMYKDLDPTHPKFASISASFPLNEGTGYSVSEATGTGINGSILNGGNWSSMKGVDHFKNLNLSYDRPNVSFHQGNYVTTVANDTIIDTLMNNPYLVNQYQVYSKYGQLRHDSIGVIASGSRWEATPEVLYGPTGNIVNSFPVTPDGTINIAQLPYYQRTAARFEIMSFVTPYGLGLNMGVSGETWAFDVTDFGPILKGDHRLTMERGGQWQEDMDIKFLFIVGTPPREVKDISQIWRVDYPSYTDIISNKYFEPRNIPLDATGEYFKIRSAITGHGQEGEFIPRTHYVDIDGGAKEFNWQVWKTCGANPVYPQGGTWIYDRAGWCPGMATDVQEYDITSMVTAGSTVNIDYGITTASGTSRYIVNHQLVTYGDANFSLDAAVVDILSPSSKIEYDRTSSVCEKPQVLIRNTGKTTLTSLVIEYWVNNSTTPQTFNWSGSLEFMEEEVVSLPRRDALWDDLSGTSEDVFNVEVKSPNNGTDGYGLNNTLGSSFEIPDVFPNSFFIWFKTNSAASDNSYTIEDQYGNEIFKLSGLTNNTNYRDTFNLNSGCYVLKLQDNGGNGISFWANNDGNGIFQIRPVSGGILKNFQGDFGNFHTYNFTVDAPLSYEELYPSEELLVYPNPTKDIFNVELMDASKATVTIVNGAGQVLQVPKTNENNNLITFDVSSLSEGIYYVKVETDKGVEMKKIVKI